MTSVWENIISFDVSGKYTMNEVNTEMYIHARYNDVILQGGVTNILWSRTLNVLTTSVKDISTGDCL